MKVIVCRKAHFNAAHRLHNPAWSDEKNREVFGKCNSPNYHGHNFDLEVRVRGEVNPDTGFVIDMLELGQIVKDDVEERFDHKNLNLDCPEFEGKLASAENLAEIIYGIMKERLPQFEVRISLFETAKNSVELGDW